MFNLRTSRTIGFLSERVSLILTISVIPAISLIESFLISTLRSRFLIRINV